MATHGHAFAHVLLPRFTYSDPQRMLGALAGPDAAVFLERLWAEAGKLAEQAKAGPSGASVDVRPFDHRSFLALLTFAPPEEPPEAYFAAVVVRFAAPHSAEVESVRYFTLEKTVEMAGVAAHRARGVDADRAPQPRLGAAERGGGFVAEVIARVGRLPRRSED
jgi:hypothetical protein